MSDFVEIASIFHAVFAKRPLPPAPDYDADPPLDWIVERARRYRHVRDVICNELRATGLTASIATKDQRIDLPANDLAHADAIRLGDAGHLSTELWALRGYREYSGVVFVPASIKVRAVKTACEELGAAGKRGRPNKVEQSEIERRYRELFPNGHEAERLSWKQVLQKIGLPVSVDTLKRALGKKK